MAFWQKKVGGEIAYYDLNDWWEKTLTKEERTIIKTTLNPMMISGKSIDEGEISFSSKSRLAFLGSLSSWFKKPELYSIGKKILQVGEECYKDSNDVLDQHYFCLEEIRLHYANREYDATALEKAIYFCKEQIKLAPKAKAAFRQDPNFRRMPLPLHSGYQQLAIIYEKQKRYADALALSEEAYSAGWNQEDCSKRIPRLKKKIQSE